MKRAQNSDSKTHVKKLNPTSRTEIRRKTLYYLFLETPCISFAIVYGIAFFIASVIAFAIAFVIAFNRNI